MLRKKLFGTSPIDLQAYRQYLLSERQVKIKEFKELISHRNYETVEYEDGTTYTGQLSYKNQKQGFGMCECRDQSIYMGKFKDDNYHSEGYYLYSDGERYQGQINQGLKEGIGKYYYLNGDVYEGQWIQGQKQGEGTMFYANGDKYEGLWKQNKQAGEGTYFKNGKPYCQGEWIHGQFQKGKVYTEFYKGQWEKGTRNGKGIYEFDDGSSYEGEWINGQKNGVGKYTFANGNSYEGQFRGGLKHGKGLYKYSTGDYYEGTFENDLKSGYGKMEFLNGDMYLGEWKNDLFHGKGKYIFNKKVQISGNFVSGKLQKEERQKEGKRSSPNKSIFETQVKYKNHGHRNRKHKVQTFESV